MAADASSSATRPASSTSRWIRAIRTRCTRASWERVRGPYFLKSGGPGSALWKTTDGGKSWHEIKGGGFPETNKGRMNIQIAREQSEHRLRDGRGGLGARRKAAAAAERPLSLDRRRAELEVDEHRSTTAHSTSRRSASTRRIRIASIGWRSISQFSDDGGYSWRTGMVGNHEDYHGMWIDPERSRAFHHRRRRGHLPDVGPRRHVRLDEQHGDGTVLRRQLRLSGALSRMRRTAGQRLVVRHRAVAATASCR